jgi:hypothetical protein
MEMATKREMLEAVALLCEAWNKELSPMLGEIYCNVLSELDRDELRHAVTELLKSNRAFMPPPGVVLNIAKKYRNRKLYQARLEREKLSRQQPSKGVT